MLDLFAKRKASIRNDVLSGITVALALIPEAIAIAFVAGVSPQVGLYSAIIIGFVASAFGGRPGMISGATGAMAVVVVGLVSIHGVGYLFPAVILCGLIQVTVGLFKLGKLIRLVPHSVMLGFVNGLAIVIFTSQFGSFKVFGSDGGLHWLTGAPMVLMLLLVAVTMVIIAFLPRLTKAVPSSLAAILGITLVGIGINHYAGEKLLIEGNGKAVLTVGDMLVANLKERAVRQERERKVNALEGTEIARRNGDDERLVLTEAEIAQAATAEVAPEMNLPKLFFLDEAVTSPEISGR